VRSISIGAPAYPALAFYANDVYKAGIIVAGVNWTFGTVAGNHITFEPGGSEKVVFKDNGWVGIGTGSPANRLHIVGANTASRGQLTVVGSSTDARITLYSDSSFLAAFSASSSDSYIGTESNTPFRFITNGSEKVRIAAGGDVGIGTTSPGYPLDVQRANNNGVQTVAFFKNTGTTGTLYQSRIIVEGIDASTGLVLGRTASSTAHFGGVAGNFIDTYSTSDPLFFATGGNPRIYIAGGGNVGIGTTSPFATLHVRTSTNEGTIAVGHNSYPGTLYANAGTGELRIDNRSSAAAGYITFYPNGQNTTLGNEAMRITTARNVGIGTTNPANGRLQVNASIRIDDDAGGAGSDTFGSSSILYIGSTGGGGAFQYDASRGIDLWQYNTGGSWARTVRFTRDGNVGIGTTSPGGQLEVSRSDGGRQMLLVRNYSAGSTGAFTGNYVAEIRSAYTTGATGGALLVHTQEASDARPTMAVSDSNGVFATFVNGKVGIGTATPGFLLHVKASGNYGTIASDSSSNTGGGGFAVRKNGSTIGVLANKGAWYGDTTNDLIVAAETGYNFRIYTNGSATERFIFTTGGNFGVNTTNTSERIHVVGSVYCEGEGTGFIVDASGNKRVGLMKYAGLEGALVHGNACDLRFGQVNQSNVTGGTFTEQMAINTSGDVRINGSGWATSKLQVTTASTSTPAAEFNGTGNSGGLAPVYIWNNAESGNRYFINFYTDGINNPRTYRGDIRYRGATNDLALVTASDYRIKTLHGAYTKSGEVFDKIEVHDGTMHGATMGHLPMIVAHELQEAYPAAVDGEKDAVNEDGTPKLQMVSYTAMIPLMLAEIKSLRARVAELEAR
jgi:hypothetical protein